VAGVCRARLSRIFFARPVVIIDGVSFRKHALVQDARYQNAVGGLSAKHGMLGALHPAEAGPNLATRPPERRIIGEHLATSLKIIKVTDGLVFTPGTEGMCADAEQVGFGPARETICGHGLAGRCGKVQCFSDTRKHVALGNTAGVAFINGGA
jgi:hypothetical protein